MTGDNTMPASERMEEEETQAGNYWRQGHGRMVVQHMGAIA
jgi:hypothetical protein